MAATPGEPTPSTIAIRERPATGESEGMLDALLNEFEPSSNIRGEERRWGETFSHEMVEELHLWLMQSQDHPAAPSPPHDRESRTQNLSITFGGGGGSRQSSGRAIRRFRGTFENNKRARRDSNSSL